MNFGLSRPTSLRLNLVLVLLVSSWSLSAGRAAADDPNVISFDDVKFPMELNDDFERSLLTAEVTALADQRIRIRGFIRPSVKQSGIQQFILVRDNLECCFGPGAMLYDCMIVRLAPEQSTEVTTRPITVEGTFFIKEFKGPDGHVWAIYNLKDAVVR